MDSNVQMDAVVVVPARDERELLPGCLQALARQTLGTDRFEIVLVADGCSDDTATVAAECATLLGLKLTTLHGPGSGSGPARRLGMEAAAQRLMSAGRPGALIATTDADSRPAADWLERQLEHVAHGAEAVGGMIELDPDDEETLPDAVMRRRRLDAEARLNRLRERDPNAAHHHFAGASIGVTADAYRRVGGMEAVSALEDERFHQRLIVNDVPIVHAADVRVRTSARTDSRASRGLGVDLAVSRWLELRRYHADDFALDRLKRLKGETTVTVIIPTKECGTTITDVISETVGPMRDAGLIDELVVVDAESTDGTAPQARTAGARVVQEGTVLTDFGPALGKGDAMWRAVSDTSGDIICFLDGDTTDPDARHLQGLLGPLLTEPSLQFVKGSFERPLRVGNTELPNEGGRVTELMARPLLNLYEPLLAGFAQPLAGEFSARRELLESLAFPVGYGVEIALLIDSLRSCGIDALAECQLGTRQNRHQALRALGEMAYAVLAAVELRRHDSPLNPPSGHYLKPWEGAVARVPVLERPPLTELSLDQTPLGEFRELLAQRSPG